MRAKLFIFGIFVILCLGIVSAESCDVVRRSTCRSGSYVIMSLSSLTNAHGELADQRNYDYDLCCDFGTGDTTCTGDPTRPDNKIVGLSSETNAHAEKPGFDTYEFDICYGNLACVKSNDECPGNHPIEVLSLSSSTNAHLSEFSVYNKKICCKLGEPLDSECDLDEAYWTPSGPVEDGTEVTLNIEGTDCVTKEVQFDIGEVDCTIVNCEYGEITNYHGTDQLIRKLIIGNFDDGVASVSWEAEWHWDNGNSDDPEYVFRALLTSDTSNEIDESGKLIVTPSSEGLCGDGHIDDGEDCECGADEICGNEDDDVGTNTCQSEGYEGGELSCSNDCTFDIIDCYGDVLSCGGYYNSDDCEANVEGVEIYLGEEYIPYEDEYNVPQGPDCLRRLNGIGCVWDVSGGTCDPETEFQYHPDNPEVCIEPTINCEYDETVTGNCNGGDEFLEISYTTTTGTSSCDLDPKLIPCLSQLKLPFFGFYSFIITLILIALIYVGLIKRK